MSSVPSQIIMFDWKKKRSVNDDDSFLLANFGCLEKDFRDFRRCRNVRLFVLLYFLRRQRTILEPRRDRRRCRSSSIRSAFVLVGSTFDERSETNVITQRSFLSTVFKRNQFWTPVSQDETLYFDSKNIFNIRQMRKTFRTKKFYLWKFNWNCSFRARCTFDSRTTWFLWVLQDADMLRVLSIYRSASVVVLVRIWPQLTAVISCCCRVAFSFCRRLSSLWTDRYRNRRNPSFNQ